MVDLTGGFAMSVKLKQNINRDLVFASLNSFDKRLIMTSCIMPKGARQGKKLKKNFQGKLASVFDFPGPVFGKNN